MADENSNLEQNKQDNSNPSGEACTSPSCCSEKKNENNTVKWALFSIIMLAAIGIGSTTLIRKMNSANAPAAGECAPGSVCKDGTPCPPKTVSEKTGSVSVLCGMDLRSMKEFNTLTGSKNVAFILLPGDKNEKAKAVAADVNGFIEKKIKDKSDVAVYTLKNDAGGHDQLVQNFGIKSFPSVVVLGRGCKSSAISGEVTEERLTGALTLARMPMDNCGSTCQH